MKSSEFSSYRAQFRAAMQKVLAEAEPGRLDENGFPAYSHGNPLINWLFWKRIHTVMDHVEKRAPYDRVMDFGCGSGVMLPFLARVSREVVAADIDLQPLEHMRLHIDLADNVQPLDASMGIVSQLPKQSFDLILALDVLEHVQDLSNTAIQLLRLLKPGAELVISAPTENRLYQIGRKLAGPEYSGEYHERGAEEIRRALGARAELKHIATLYWPIRLFEIFAALKPRE